MNKLFITLTQKQPHHPQQLLVSAANKFVFYNFNILCILNTIEKAEFLSRPWVTLIYSDCIPR